MTPTIAIESSGFGALKWRMGRMYGIVNKAIEDFVCDRYGLETWDGILSRSRQAPPVFLSALDYDDPITLELIAAASAICSLPPQRFAEEMGAHWARGLLEGFPEMMNSGAPTFEALLDTLERARGRILLLFPGSAPPRFTVRHPRPGLSMVYHGPGHPLLAPSMRGLIRGLAKHMNVRVDIVDRRDRDELMIRWSREP